MGFGKINFQEEQGNKEQTKTQKSNPKKKKLGEKIFQCDQNFSRKEMADSNRHGRCNKKCVVIRAEF